MRARHHVTVLHFDVGSHGGQALDVLVHRTRANGAAARQGDFGMAEAGQQRSERQHRGAHGLDQFVRGFGRVQRAGIQVQQTIFSTFGLHPHVADQLEHGGHVLEARHIAQRHRLGGQQAGAQLGEGRVLGARNGDLALQAAAAANQEFVHGLGQACCAAHSAGVKVFIDRACTSSVCILAPSVA